MPDYLRPDPILVAFLPVKQGLYLVLLLPLVLLRCVAARGPARAFALLALALCAGGLAARFLPEFLGVYQGAGIRLASVWRNLLGGMGMNLAASAALLASGVLPGRRWWGIDAVHLLLLAALLGLWVYTLV